MFSLRQREIKKREGKSRKRGISGGELRTKGSKNGMSEIITGAIVLSSYANDHIG